MKLTLLLILSLVSVANQSVILNPKAHPVGTRLLLAHPADPSNKCYYRSEFTEKTIVEWSGMGLVKLIDSAYGMSDGNWHKPSSLRVVEVLPAKSAPLPYSPDSPTKPKPRFESHESLQANN